MDGRKSRISELYINAESHVARCLVQNKFLLTILVANLFA